MLLIILFFLSCGGNKDSSESVEKNVGIVDKYAERETYLLSYFESKGILFLNDSAKWYLYNIYCDDTVPSSITGPSERVFLSYLKLRPVAYGYSSDSSVIDIGYRFLYHDTMPIDNILTKYHYLVDGVSFNLESKQITGFIRGHGGHFMVPGAESRFINPIQPEVISFVNQNSDKLNQWYKEALERNGIILKKRSN